MKDFKKEVGHEDSAASIIFFPPLSLGLVLIPYKIYIECHIAHFVHTSLGRHHDNRMNIASSCFFTKFPGFLKTSDACGGV